MKYWNKQKAVRLRCWACVQLSTEPRGKNWGNLFKKRHIAYKRWKWESDYDDLKRKLQNTVGKGKFYMRVNKREIWFQNSEDACLFILRGWCEKT